MNKLLIGMLPFAGLVGCATPSYNYTPAVQNLSKPPIGQVATASIGDHMLTQGIMTIILPENWTKKLQQIR